MNGLTVLSLCDGMSCCRIALEKAGFKVDKYYASEIKDIGIKVTQDNYPDTIQIGDVTKVEYKNGILITEKGNFNVGKIDLVAFGSPCQSFSQAMNTAMRIGLKDPVRSGLFFECYRVLKEVDPTWWLLENVASMKDVDRDILTSYMGIEPIKIDGALVSAALRKRYYWTNIPGVTQPQDKGITLQSILTSGYTDRLKARALLVSDSRPLVDKQKMLHRYKKFTTLVWEEPGNDDSIRYLNQTELERCHNIPEGYTRCLSRNDAANVIGDGWTIDVVAHIFSFMPTKQNDLSEAI